MVKKSTRIASVLLSLALVFSLLSVSAFAAETTEVTYAVATTSDTVVTYNIGSADELYALQQAVNSQTTAGSAANPTVLNCVVNITSDINMNNLSDGKTWEGIGKPQSFIGFTGTVNGNNHRIYNLTLDNSGNTNGPKGGLFNLAVNTTINDLTIEGSVDSTRFIGGLVGRALNNLTLNNCTVNMDLTLEGGASNSVGGLIGQCGSGTGNEGNGNGASGGTLGEITISYCQVKGALESKTANNPVGGMIGHVYAGYEVSIENSTLYGTSDLTLTTPSGTAKGAYVGNNAGEVAIYQCTNNTGISDLAGINTGTIGIVTDEE